MYGVFILCDVMKVFYMILCVAYDTHIISDDIAKLVSMSLRVRGRSAFHGVARYVLQSDTHGTHRYTACGTMCFHVAWVSTMPWNTKPLHRNMMYPLYYESARMFRCSNVQHYIT